MMASSFVNGMDRTAELFSGSANPFIPETFIESDLLKRSYKRRDDYLTTSESAIPSKTSQGQSTDLVIGSSSHNANGETNPPTPKDNNQLAVHRSSGSGPGSGPSKGGEPTQAHAKGVLVSRRPPPKVPVPDWHPQWELSAVLSGHLGWVRAIAFDPTNEWFATGSADRTIKIWDFPKSCSGSEGSLKLTLTGHISAVRGLVVSPRHPYLFSVGEDKMVKCWDLEYNKVIRHYHGHLSGVYCCKLHPTLDLLITGGRDSVARVWDMRTKHQIHVLGGHTDTVSSIITSAVDPQVITASHDSTIKLFDLAAGKAMSTLTHHKKAVRSIAPNPKELSFVSAGADNLKKWQARDGKFLQNISGHNSVVNCAAVNEEGIVASCGDDGTINFWDYGTGYRFQNTKTIPQPGSLDAEAGIFAAEFDLSGSRLLTAEADKTIKIWRENRESTEESDAIDMKAW
eukprot:CAMPEP_0119045608 /NCGR_PEP_ID=MMETSP1177-20130426/41229_1 /TAXON_ID=2985 /ORGANISM="Ochromonas sp, Strain CCMP1899" /LENGTH=455 /DNA_ID=CAMNT_0007017663 /DNA_START=119 /DNA_END=1483 /DNA_ORIENTATION=-